MAQLLLANLGMRACLLLVAVGCGARTELSIPPDASSPVVDASHDVAHPPDVEAPDVDTQAAPTVLATTDAPAYAITVDAKNVYWTQGHWGPANAPTYSLALQCEKTNCKTPMALAMGLDIVPLSIAVDHQTIYWTAQGPDGFDPSLHGSVPNGIYACAIGGCGQSPQALVAGSMHNVFTDAGRLFWIGSDDVEQCISGDCGASATSLATGNGSVRIDGGYAYWSTSSAIMRCPLSASGCAAAPVVVVADSPAQWNPNVPNFRPFAIDAANIYWTSNGVLLRCPKEGCAVPTVIMPFGKTYAQCIETDGVNVYWTAPNAIVRCPVSGCAKPVRVYMSFPASPPMPSPNCLALDETNVYWTTGGIGYMSAPGAGSVMMLPK